MATGKPKKPLMGAHWMETAYPKQYQLYRRVEDVATDLANRRMNGWGPTKAIIDELFDIATQVKVLDLKS